MKGILNFKNIAKIGFKSAKWHFDYYFLKKDFPLIAAFQLTNVCNFKCKMCNIWKNPKKNTIPIVLFKNYIDDLSKMGCCYISLSGGEPLLIKNIENYIFYAKRKIPVVNLVTNGFILNKNIILKLKDAKLDTISISIDALGEKHDKIRGIKGSYDKTIESIHNIKHYAPDIKIVINTVISPWNIDDLPALIKLTEDFKIYQKFQPINQHPIYNNKNAQKLEIKITPDFINKLKSIIKELKKKKYVLNSNYFLSSIPYFFLKKNIKGLFNENCNLSYYYCDIRENSEIYPCLNGMCAKGGLTIKNGLKNTYKSKEYKELQKKLIKCKYCQEDFQICHLEPRITFPIRNFFKYNKSLRRDSHP